MGLLPRVGRSFALLRMAVSVVVLSVVRDLLGWVIAKSREVLRIAQDDSECCRPERSEGSPWWGYCQESGGPSRCSG
ncbi:hypothetical protein [Legionella maceachernii]|uniref:hypothetical protein n=1 Tax=Legionella maceachernii TaxID=466 RepID=UPI001056473E|nr:hypothetical protein [Legionella maceachernii]